MEIPHDSLDMGEMVTVHQALSSAWILRAWFTPEPLGLANGWSWQSHINGHYQL
jgi:hypothetical protein